MPRLKYLSSRDLTGYIMLLSRDGHPLLLHVLDRDEYDIHVTYGCKVLHSTQTRTYRVGTVHLFGWQDLARGKRMKQCPNCNHWRKWGQFQADYLCATCRKKLAL